MLSALVDEVQCRAVEALIRNYDVAAAAENEKLFAFLIELFDRLDAAVLAVDSPEPFRRAANPQRRQRRGRR